MNFELTTEQIQILNDTENAAHLRDLNVTPAWAIYKQLAQSFINQKTREYLNENYSQDQAWAARTKLQGMMELEARMEHIVHHARDMVHPAAIELTVLENEYREATYGNE